MKQEIISTIPFVSREDYPEMLRIVDDPDNIPPDYESFLIRLDKIIMDAAKEGFNLIKVPIKPSEFAEWCRSQNRKIDGKARAAYAAFVYGKTRLPNA